MRARLAFAAALTTLASAALAAPPKFMVVDLSMAALMDKPAAEAIWREALPAERLARLYKPSRWGFSSEVDGGLTPAGICVVSASAGMLPVTRGTMQLPPTQRSVTFDAQPNLSPAQCKALAAAKLKEAVQSVISGLVKE